MVVQTSFLGDKLATHSSEAHPQNNKQYTGMPNLTN